MKYFIIFLFLICLNSNLYSQSLDCLKYKTGKFGYPELPGKISWRKNSVQESYNNGILEMLWKVKWLSECQYQLTCEKLFVNKYPIKVGDKIIATIISTDENCFTTQSIYYNAENPKGLKIPESTMCLEK
jgi:hypothetical protein